VYPVTGVDWRSGIVIVDKILDVVFGALTSIVGLLPNNTLDLSGLTAGSAYLSWVGIFVNMTALTAAVGVIIAGEAALLGVRTAIWLWRLTPFS
jgi:uncharacterized membrane-anchored protein